MAIGVPKKTAIVAGMLAGMGKETAREPARRGMRVVMTRDLGPFLLTIILFPTELSRRLAVTGV